MGADEAAEVEAIEGNRTAEVPQAISEALSEARVGLAMIDGRSERVVFANEALLAITGRSPGQTIGAEFVQLLEPVDVDRVRLRLRETAFGAATGAPLSVRMRDAGERTTVADVSFRACAQRGRPTVVAVVTVARAREAGALRQALDHAIEALRQRDDFFALATHELLTPLTSVLLNLQSASAVAQRDPSRVGPALASAESQAKRVSVLVEQLLDVARMRAGRLVLDYGTSDLRSVLLEVCGRFSEECIRAGSTFEIACTEPVIGRWDASRLGQVMENLLSNALKYSPGQPIRVALRADRRRAMLTVGDRGRGISTADLARVFERFERAHDGPVRGTGLGLWIARQLVEAHGGTIEVASEPGHGATFVVELPLA